MKIKIIIVSIIILIVGGIVVFLLVNKKDSSKELYVIKESHYIVNSKKNDSKLIVTCFYSKDQIDFIDDNTTIFLCDEKSKIKMPLNDLKINSNGRQKYKNKKLYEYSLQLSLPIINDTYHLKKCYLKVNTADNVYELTIGELYVEYTDNYVENSNFNVLDCKKRDTPRVSQIIIGLKENKPVKEVYVGPKKCEYFYDKNQLIININNEETVLQSTFVKLIENNETNYIPKYKYITSYELLEKGFHTKYNMIN